MAEWKANMKAIRKPEEQASGKLVLRFRNDSETLNKDIVTARAKLRGMSVNDYILNAIAVKIRLEEEGYPEQDQDIGWIVAKLIKWGRKEGISDTKMLECIHYICADDDTDKKAKDAAKDDKRPGISTMSDREIMTMTDIWREDGVSEEDIDRYVKYVLHGER